MAPKAPEEKEKKKKSSSESKAKDGKEPKEKKSSSKDKEPKEKKEKSSKDKDASKVKDSKSKSSSRGVPPLLSPNQCVPHHGHTFWHLFRMQCSAIDHQGLHTVADSCASRAAQTPASPAKRRPCRKWKRSPPAQPASEQRS